MPDTPFTPDELARYAEVAIDRCLDLRPGELLQLTYQPAHRPLAIALARAAYRRGLRFDAYLDDPLVQRAEIDLASDEALGAVSPWDRDRMLARTSGEAAKLLIDGEDDPDALAGCDQRRMALRKRRRSERLAELYDRMTDNLDASLIIAYPTAAWARQVFPELPPEEAQRTLAEDLLSFCRIGAEDGPGDEALSRHIAALEARAEAANRLALRELRFRGPGTDLRLRLTEDALWTSASETNAYGRTNFCNLPSEEIYTSPAASATEGTARCTMPLAMDGLVFEDLRLEFQAGRLTRLDARTEVQRDTVLTLLDVDEGGRRLGEVALVDAASRINRRGRLYWSTLLDENQACHIALGLGFPACRRNGPGSKDLNRSYTHLDVMIGAPDVEVTGTTAGGETVPVIVDGVWRPR
jgi:aminopeptidase